MIIYLKVPKVSCKSIPGLNGSPPPSPPKCNAIIHKKEDAKIQRVSKH